MNIKIITPIILVTCLTSCMLKKIQKESHTVCNSNANKQIVILMDGTSNRPKKDTNLNTNICKLKSIVNPNVPFFYIDGVGAKGKLYGMMLGVGISRRVKHTYRYLGENYKKGDSISLFGFSRGAYSCRILSNLIYTAGIPDLTKILCKNKNKIVKLYYKHYLGNYSKEERKYRILKALAKWNKKNPTQQIALSSLNSIDIFILGLFDTVEALGTPDYSEMDFIFPNKNHLNQLDNIKHAYHAVSLDDNRANIFTPILLSTNEIADKNTCNDHSSRIQEVWFSGSHLNVGGGARENFDISNTSLNWMLAKTKEYNIFKDILYNENNTLPVKNMQKSIFWRILYKRKNRNIVKYYETSKDKFPVLNVHESVIKRLENGDIPDFKMYRKNKKDWYDQAPFNSCFTKQFGQRIFKDCNCIQVIKTK